MEQAALAAETVGSGSATQVMQGERPTPGGRIPMLRAIHAYAPDFSCGSALDCLCRRSSGSGERSEAADMAEAIRHLRDALERGWRPGSETQSRNEAAGEDDAPEFGINEFLDDRGLTGDRRAAAMFLMLAGTFFDGEAERLQYLGSALAAAERAYRALATGILAPVSGGGHAGERGETPPVPAAESQSRAHLCERCLTSSWEVCVESHENAVRDAATGGWVYCIHCALIAAFHGMDERREMAERDAARLAAFVEQLLAHSDMRQHPRADAGRRLLAELGMVPEGDTPLYEGEGIPHFAAAR